MENDKKDLDKKYQRFIPLWKYQSPEFLTLVKELFGLIRNHGLKKEPIESDDITHSFIIAVHEGWKKAQIKIAETIKDKLITIENLDKEKIKFHNNKDYDSKKITLSKQLRIKNEIRILRRFIDSIAWIILNNEHSTIRRLPLEDNLNNLSIKVIEDTLPVVNELNQDPSKIAIACDLTTFIHTGDILEFEYGKGYRIIELKSGKKNLLFSEAASFSLATGCEVFDEQFTKDFNNNDKRHYKRVKKQLIHMSDVANTINTGEGYDHYTKKTVHIHDNDYIPKFFSSLLVESWDKIRKGKTWDIHVIDECLYVGMYRDYNLGFVAFNAWLDGTEFNGTTYNINDSFSFIFSRPLLNLDLPDDLLMDIIDSKLTIVLCLDHNKFIERGNLIYPDVFEFKKIDKKLEHSGDIFTYKGKGVFTRKNNQEVYLGTGMLTRIIFDFHRPQNIIEWVYQDSDIKKNLMT
ncbi:MULTISPECIES: hypothetical protein [Pantoea]|uniref:Uncharacterized protein n=1 Tax=Pantoea brenneri TaxID=472694 RepID=A0ABU9MRM8_9GAMM|nr:hypothetical protein [Pantoea sp. 3.5.1]KKD31759.1 hypothetical protein EP46_14135 [Pantoea sp. 3.5.1]